MREKLKERESLVQTHPWASQPWLDKNSIEKGHGWAWFLTKLSLSFNFSCITFALAMSKGRENVSLGTRLGLSISAKLSCPIITHGAL